jgi:hypothetical protein
MFRLVKSIFASNPSISEPPHTGRPTSPIAELERQISLTNKLPENLPPAGLDSVSDDIISTNGPLAFAGLDLPSNEPLASPAPSSLDAFSNDIIPTNQPLALPAYDSPLYNIFSAGEPPESLASHPEKQISPVDEPPTNPDPPIPNLPVSPMNPAPSTVQSNQSEPLHGAPIPPLRQSFISWHSTKPPPTSYTSVRGDPAEDGKGYVLECTIFAHPGSPNPTQGRLGDIYLDTASNLVYAYVPADATSRWQNWDTTSKILRHPLLPEYRLYSQRNHGIKWGTDNAINIENFRVGNSPEMPASVQKTIAYHKQLDPQFDGKSIRSRRRVIDNPNRIKKEGDVNQSQREQSEKTKGKKRRRGKDGTEETIDESNDEGGSMESAKTRGNKRRGKEGSKETVDDSRDEEPSAKRLNIYIPKEKFATLNRVHTYDVPSTAHLSRSRCDSPTVTTPSLGNTFLSPVGQDNVSTPPSPAVQVDLPMEMMPSFDDSFSSPAGQDNFSTPPSPAVQVDLPMEMTPSLTPNTTPRRDNHMLSPPQPVTPPNVPTGHKPSLSSRISNTVRTIYQHLQLNPLAWLKRAGIEFPATARTIKWVSGIFTVVPWAETGKKNKPNPVSLSR